MTDNKFVIPSTSEESLQPEPGFSPLYVSSTARASGIPHLLKGFGMTMRGMSFQAPARNPCSLSPDSPLYVSSPARASGIPHLLQGFGMTMRGMSFRAPARNPHSLAKVLSLVCLEPCSRLRDSSPLAGVRNDNGDACHPNAQNN